MNLNEDIVPTNLEEAVQLLKDSFDEKELKVVKSLTPTKLHMSVGQFIRNQWSLWDVDNRLPQWFLKEYGVSHADDISGIILECLVADLNNRPRQDKTLAKEFIEHWEKHKRKIK